MHAGKLLALIAIGLAFVLGVVFFFVEDLRPAMVKGWFRAAAGLTPAKTPTECMDRFRDAIKKRDYTTAAELYCTGDYREQVLKVARGAKKLGQAIDALTYQMDNHGVINPKTKYILRLLEPFPKSIKVIDVKESSGTAVVTVTEEDPFPKLDTPLPASFVTDHGLMIASLVPVVGMTHMELRKDASGHWHVNLTVTTRLRQSVDKLQDSATNYANAILKLRDEVKNDPGTKENVQAQLERYLNESK